ncbi:MAG TPA: NHL repeat-containing protein [Solirubrobacterales bacterium]|nr:NHL repeat-containing protein [Solirubrobacterales bacterium]
MKRIWIGLLTALTLAVALPPVGAQAAPGDPLFVLRPEPEPLDPNPIPPPSGHFEGPCGLAVDGAGNFYVSDYYHHVVDVFSSGPVYSTQIKAVDPLDGPCGLAVDSTNRVYVNDFHRNVVRYGAAPSFGSGTVIAGAGVDESRPTGVAVDSTSDDAYVNQRTRIGVFDSAGAEGEPIGAGDLEDGYGVAVSVYGPTEGLVYVPDAATNTIKVFDPEATTELVAEIDGSETPRGRFVSLRDSAIAVDNSTGEIYVVDDVTPEYKEGHEGVVYVFGPGGAYKGRLKYSVQLAQPAGLAVDNSGGLTQGRVYVTSGYSERAAVYAYAPNSEGTVAVPLPVFVPGPGGGGGSSFAQNGEAAPAPFAASKLQPDPDSASVPTPPGHRKSLAGVSARPGTALVQKGNIRVKVSGQLSPKKLPRKGAAPISVSVGGDITTTDQSPPPRLLSLSIELNRNGRIDSTGLPVCPYDALEPASSKRALSACRPALVGEGTFDAEIALPGQPTYPAHGKMLAFNGRKGGKPVLFGHIYSPHPFANSFVIVFQIEKARGTYGTKLEAKLPRSLGNWGKLTGIELNLNRRYSYKGQRRSYVSAGCPAPKGSNFTVFSLARTTFGFEGGRTLAGTLTGTCTPR